MKLVFYSGGQSKRNQLLHRAAVEMALDGRSNQHVRFTYVPFCADRSEVYFRRAVKRYRPHGVSEFHCLPLDAPVSREDLKKALSSDIIYLAGGNTFYFLKYIQSQKLLEPLRKFAKGGGVIAGLSAGAIIMTPHIQLAATPEFDADENEVGLKNLKSLGLVDFEFSPHYYRSDRLDSELKAYSLRNRGRVIFAATDGSGLIVNGDNFTAIGKVQVFHRGQTFKV